MKQRLESFKPAKRFVQERTVGYEAAEVTANDAVPSGTFALVKLQLSQNPGFKCSSLSIFAGCGGSHSVCSIAFASIVDVPFA